MDGVPWKAVAVGVLLSLGFSARVCAQTQISTGPLLPTTVAAQLVRVRLDTVISSTNISGIGLRFPNGKMELGFRSIHIQWSKANAPGLTSWLIEDRRTGEILSRVTAKKLEINGMDLRSGLTTLPDQLTLFPVGRGISRSSSQSADLIATMNVEAYLRGVLPAEMPAAWPLESLKAQAIAARTFALYKKGLRGDANFDVESTVMDQVFLNPLHSLRNTNQLNNVERAVSETRGLILVDTHAQPLAAFFHADCGGQTEEAKELWGQGEKQGTAIDGACPYNSHSHWHATYSYSEIIKKLKAASLISNKERQLAGIEKIGKTSSGRIGRLRLIFDDGSDATLTGHEFRMALGHDRLKSTKFEFVKTALGINFSGLGAGHGVGMCQWGARHMGASGGKVSDILAHYYPRARLNTDLVKPESL